MSDSVASKTGAIALLSLQNVAASTVVVGSAQDVSSKLGGVVRVLFGRRSASSGTASANIRLEFSTAASGDGATNWNPFAVFSTEFAACEAEAVSGTVNAGTATITVASTTNLTAGDVIFISNSTAANSEWGRIKSIVTNTSVTIEENLNNAQTGSTIYDAAEIYTGIRIPPDALRVRAVFDGSLFTQNCAVYVEMSTTDKIVTT